MKIAKMETNVKTCIIGALLLAVSSSYPLRASTAYAYSMNDVGLNLSGGTLFNHQTSLASNTSSFSGAGTDTNSGPTDPPETEAGPGPFPPENSFGPQGQVGLGYSRADTQIRGASSKYMSGSNVAEAYITAPGNASDLAYDKFTLGYFPDVAATPISFRFFANPTMQVTTTGDGSAEAAIAFVVNIYNHATGALLLSWFPDGNALHDTDLSAGSTSNVRDPASLNEEIDCSGNCSKSYSTSNIWTLSYKGPPGVQYDVTIGWEETTNVVIPEPATLGLTGGALILFGLALKRRRRASVLMD